MSLSCQDFISKLSLFGRCSKVRNGSGSPGEKDTWQCARQVVKESEVSIRCHLLHDQLQHHHKRGGRGKKQDEPFRPLN